MAFDGLTVSFWGAVTAAVPTDQTGVSRLLCENLNAQLNRKISFTQPEAAPADLGIETVEARHHVVLEAYQYEQRSLAAVRRGELSSIRLVQSSGEFEGAGPGELSSWTRGGNVKFASSEQAEANQPARQTTPRWQYANVRFEGQIRGNMRRHDAVLDDRVKVIAAPVGEALTRFQSSQITEATPEAENAVYLQCDKLRIVQPAAPNQERRYTEIFATGGTDLEGHVFRAKADELTFEERLGRFTLRGLGRDARLFHQPQPGVRANTSEARMIIFEPATRYVSTDRLKGINSGL
jgi:hypothetical protein